MLMKKKKNNYAAKPEIDDICDRQFRFGIGRALRLKSPIGRIPRPEGGVSHKKKELLQPGTIPADGGKSIVRYEDWETYNLLTMD
jgi:hypothetical protein